MACIDDEWANFLSDGSIILSNEKSSAKSNIKKSYSVCDKLSDNANNIDDSRIVKKSNTLLPLSLPLSRVQTFQYSCLIPIHKQVEKITQP